MKVSYSYELEAFSPVKFKITVENKQELMDLWHRLNISEDNLQKCMDRGSTFRAKGNTLTKLWEAIEEVRLERDFYI